MKFKSFGWKMVACLVLGLGTADAAAWNVMDWIDGWYETSTPALQQQLDVDQATINCKNLAIRATPALCLNWIRNNPVAGITQYVPYINPNTSTVQSDASLYSSYTVGSPVQEVDIDDFFATYSSWYSSRANAPQFLSQTITNLKSVNHELKFGITLYEDELDPTHNPYIDNTHLPSTVKAQFDVIRLFLHYRADGPNYATYVAQAKAAFPHAQIVAGVYSYDRIDYWPCAQSSSAPCTQQQELSFFQQALTIQAQLLRQGVVIGLDCYPGYFGDETQLFATGSTLPCKNVARCVQDTVTMRNDLLAAKGGSVSEVSNSPTITQQPMDATLTPGQTEIFSVSATGPSPLSYQWEKNGTEIVNATDSSYHTPSVTLADTSAAYTCLIKNAYGSVTSLPATLTVTSLGSSGTAPAITRQPGNTTLTPGQTELFSISATGAAPLSYQWQKNGSDIADATTSSYQTLPAKTSDNDSRFRCIVSNRYGSVTSDSGFITIW